MKDRTIEKTIIERVFEYEYGEIVERILQSHKDIFMDNLEHSKDAIIESLLKGETPDWC